MYIDAVLTEKHVYTLRFHIDMNFWSTLIYLPYPPTISVSKMPIQCFFKCPVFHDDNTTTEDGVQCYGKPSETTVPYREIDEI